VSDVTISVRGLVKTYEVYARPADLALEVLTRRKRHSEFRALDDVSFDVKRGEVLGIIGSNGAGKSTLLKLITGVLEPSAGSISVAGKVTAILELGLGFNPEYSGRDNIYLSGLLYGMDRNEVDRKIDEIIAFSGLADFVEQPVRTYSSGMHSRLAFSIATAVEPDILIIDEALAAGDAAFVQKCLHRIRKLCSGGRTVLLVSHGTGLLAQLCNRVLWMQRGRVRMLGPAIGVVQAYDLAAHQDADAQSWLEAVEDDLAADPSAAVPGSEEPLHERAPADAFRGAAGDGSRHVFRRGPVLIDSVEMFDAAGEPTTRLTTLKPFSLKVRYHVEGDIPEETLGVAVAVNGGYDLSSIAQFYTQNIRPFEDRESYHQSPDRQRAFRLGVIELSFDYVPLRKGEYFFSIGLVPNVPGAWSFYEYRHFYYKFTVDDSGLDLGAPIFLNASVRHFAQAAEGTKVAPTIASAVRPVTPDPQFEEKPEFATLRAQIEAVCIEKGGYPEHWPRHEACPACQSPGLAKAFRKYGLSHSACGQCGFVCVDPYPPDDVLNELYSGAYYSRIREFFEKPLLAAGGEGTPFSAPRATLEAIIERTTEGRDRGRWLDVGGGAGAFVQLIRTKRPDWFVALNELNPQSIRIARELFGIEAIDADAKALRESGERFDVVSSVAVLEHIPQPYDFLRAYADLVTPGGWMVVVIPQFTDLNRLVSKGSSPNAVPPYHVSLFQERALRKLLSRIDGFETVAVEQIGPAAFELIHAAQTGDNWDISTPTVAEPVPRSIMVEPYDQETVTEVNVLGKWTQKFSDFFADHDGRLYLVAYCRRSTSRED
jgi:ABC-type polysaccharide/polyol phosphate transport system ATPase subunit/SAM-dependent methyltransferase